MAPKSVYSRRSRPLVERLWEKIDIRSRDECWPWLGSKNQDGYGKIAIGRGSGNGYAHRIAYEAFTGTELGELRGLHSCDNPSCCNPNHIFAGSQADNVADMKAKGREKKRPLYGSDNPQAKLSESDVLDIRALLAHGSSQRQVAKIFAISQGQVARIGGGTRWAHLTNKQEAIS